ncbi:hypothetical protein MY3296_002921 [Beauveria thailandica]
MATTASLLQWAANHGVVLDGVEPRSISGRGLGMVATRRINEGDVVVTVPTSAIRSRHTLPKALMARAPTNMTLHGLLAADLLLYPPSSGVWGKLVPSLTDFNSSTSFFWPNLLRKQQTKFQQDWYHAKKVLPDLAEQEYLYSWFLVGTRSFYYEIEATLSYPSHDRLALLPVADMTYPRTARIGQARKCTRSTAPHSNDFLLAEFRGDVKDHRRRIRELRDDANAAKMDMLLQRWNQLDELAWAKGRAKQQSRGKDTKNKIR